MRSSRCRNTLLAFASVLGACMVPATAGAATPAKALKVTTFTPQLTEVGVVDLSALAGVSAAATTSSAASPAASPVAARYRAVDNQLIRHHRAGLGAAGSSATASSAVTSRNVLGESGFVGITSYQQALANANLDLEPPDQGLCAGAGYVGEFVNNAFTVYQPDGSQSLPVIPSYEVLDQPSSANLSDPRCHYDAQTGRWFLTEIVFGTATSPTSLELIAVSNTSDPTGKYTVWSIDTTDRATAGCPCFGDYDQLGVDDNGIYITTDEFSNTGPAYNGAIIYAISKQMLENYSTTGIAPVPVAYRLTSDRFGQPAAVSPTSTPAGATFAPNTEYFVESNGNAPSDGHLVVYALNDTSLLAAPGVPSLYRTSVTTEPYSVPPDAAGYGYMTFGLSGTAYHPSAAYIAFGPTGPRGPVRIAQAGAAPEDGFTCYAAFVGPSYGGCRWGDYSATVAVGTRIYMATEMIPPTSRDVLTNWGTYIWSAPAF